MNKRDKLMEIVQQILELYPQLDIVMIDDVEDPSQFSMVTTELAIAEGQLDGADIEEITLGKEDPIGDFLSKIEWDGEDEGSGGMLQ